MTLNRKEKFYIDTLVDINGLREKLREDTLLMPHDKQHHMVLHTIFMKIQT